MWWDLVVVVPLRTWVERPFEGRRKLRHPASPGLEGRLYLPRSGLLMGLLLEGFEIRSKLSGAEKEYCGRGATLQYYTCRC
jgi:hypothetical protein